MSASHPQLRPYQSRIIEDLYARIREGHRRIAIIAGTGAGKTIIGSRICADAAAAGDRLLFLVHLDVLVGQTYEKMQAFGLDCGFIKAGWPENPEAPIQIASVQTMQKRDWWRTWPANVVFYDEGHTTAFSEIGRQLMEETHPDAIHLAMTATPYRLGEEQMGDRFETFVATPPPKALQAAGFLAPMKYYSLAQESQIDLGGVRTLAGDYDERDLKNACDRPELIDCIVNEWRRLTPDKRSIAFCVDVEHARHVANAFEAAGVPSACVDGSTPLKERARLYEALASGELTMLTSCNVISIGFDVPAVEVGLLLRPTLSKALHLQQIGRVMRISPATGKSEGFILDQAGNLQRLGFPEDIDGYELPTGESGSSSDRPGRDAAGKICPQCAAVVPTIRMVCPDCGHDWRAARPINGDELVEILPWAQLQQITDPVARCAIFCALRRREMAADYDPEIARQHYFDCFNEWPPEEWVRHSLFGPEPSDGDRLQYLDFLGRLAKRRGRSPDWIRTQFEREFGEDSWPQVASA